MNLPNVYGPGAMFACSGLDRATDYKNDFVGSLMADKLGVLFNLKVRRELFFEIMGIRDIVYNTVTSDIISAVLKKWGGEAYPLSLVFADAKLIIGRTTAAAIPVVRAETKALCSQAEDLQTQSYDGEFTALATKRQGDSISFAFAFSAESLEKAVECARAGLAVDVDDLIEERLAFYRKLPQCPDADPTRQKAYYKAFSILKANIMTNEGQIPGLWTTPDRIPHRNMWLWDSVFHSIALKYISHDLAFKALEAVLDVQFEDGFVPHMASPYESSEITQPPLLAWGIWKIYCETGDKEMLRKTYPKLKKYIEWDLKNRDKNNNYLCEWFIDGDVMCRSGESGADNSSRFDNAKNMDAVDFSAFVANEAECLKQMAEVLGLMEDAQRWKDIYDRIKENLNKLLWDEEDEIYYDRIIDGDFNHVKALSCFLPMFAGIAEDWQAEKLVKKHLLNPNEFWSPLPVPAEAISEPAYGTDMWRGCVWANYNYMVICGLKRYGYYEIAGEIATKTINAFADWYRQFGCLFEFFDSKAENSPLFLDRKGKCTPPYDIRRKIFPIRDYGWTAAVYIALVLGEV